MVKWPKVACKRPLVRVLQPLEALEPLDFCRVFSLPAALWRLL
jgi:hypothetical protein